MQVYNIYLMMIWIWWDAREWMRNSLVSRTTNQCMHGPSCFVVQTNMSTTARDEMNHTRIMMFWKQCDWNWDWKTGSDWDMSWKREEKIQWDIIMNNWHMYGVTCERKRKKRWQENLNRVNKKSKSIDTKHRQPVKSWGVYVLVDCSREISRKILVCWLVCFNR